VNYRKVCEKLNELNYKNSCIYVAGSTPSVAMCMPMAHGKTSYAIKRSSEFKDVDDIFRRCRPGLRVLMRKAHNANNSKELLTYQREAIREWVQNSTGKVLLCHHPDMVEGI